MSRFGENKTNFGDENYQCYYKAQAPPGGKTSISLGGPIEPVVASKKPAAQPTPAEKENIPTRATENSAEQDAIMRNKLKQQTQAGSGIFGSAAPVQAQKNEPQPETKNFQPNTEHYKTSGFRVRQPPGGASSGLW